MIEQDECRSQGDKEGEEHWQFLIFATSTLEIEGMSDEEDGEVNGEMVKLVADVSFRDCEFRRLYRYSDVLGNKGVDGSGGPVGRKFKTRIETSKIVERSPPPRLPDAFKKRISTRSPLEAALLRYASYCYHTTMSSQYSEYSASDYFHRRYVVHLSHFRQVV